MTRLEHIYASSAAKGHQKIKTTLVPCVQATVVHQYSGLMGATVALHATVVAGTH